MEEEIYYNRDKTYNYKVVFWGTIYIFLLALEASAKNYYFSNMGNDSYTSTQAQNQATPWKTIDKLNNSMSLFTAGDFIYFKRDDIFRGQIQMTRSGSTASKITFDAYGEGDDPVISGNMEINSWTRYNGNIWVADCPQFGSIVTGFYINGKSEQIGRYPNSGYLTINSHSGNTQITSNSLTSLPNWTGGEAVVRTERWILDRVAIQLHQNQTLVFKSATAYTIKDNYGFFIQNHLGTLDGQGEWYFDPISKKMYLFSLIDPNSFSTEATFFGSTFYLSNQSNIILRNLKFVGSVSNNFCLIRSNNIEISNCILYGSGSQAVSIDHGSNISFTNDEIRNTNSSAILMSGAPHLALINSKIINTGMRAGMGESYYAIKINAPVQNFQLENNIIDSVGYDGIVFVGDSVTIRKNVFNHFCMVVDDGGAIYGNGDNGVSRLIENNIILNGIGAGAGTDDPDYTAADGLYVDSRTTNVTLLNNTVANCSHGILLHNAQNITVVGNTCFDNVTELILAHDNIASDYPIIECNIKDNIFFSRLGLVAEFRTIDNGIPKFGVIDFNYYCRPLNEDNIIYVDYISGGRVSKYKNLATWQSSFGYDLNSKKSPYEITGNFDDYVKLFYNAGNQEENYSLDKGYIDVKGIKYSSLTLQPFTSAILMVDPIPTWIENQEINKPKIIVNQNEVKIFLYEQSGRIELIDFQGRVIEDKIIDSDVMFFDISSLKPGIYIIKYSNKTVKFIKFNK